MTGCLYCRIAQGAEGAHILTQDEKTVCFLDPAPEAPGHAVIIPKAHVETVFACDEETWQAVLNSTRSVAMILNTELGVDSVTMFHSSGPNAQQHVPHLAVHLIPRKEGDTLNMNAHKQEHKHQ